jgi:methylisocitrate lyase
MCERHPRRATLFDALAAERPLQVAGAVNAYFALLAERAGFRALYLSGAGVANASRGLPDLGLIGLDDVREDARRICDATALPLLVDADTGFGGPAEIGRAVKGLAEAGAAGLHLEDQVTAKRCGHRPGKVLVSAAEMSDRIRAAVDARPDPGFAVMARTDAAGVEGLDAAVDRARRYVEVGADMVFAEALASLDEYRRFTAAVEVPVLANLTEFGRTPLFSLGEMASAGVQLVLYPLSAFRAASTAAQDVYETIRGQGTQRELLPRMQSREQLYEILDYHAQEREVDEKLFPSRAPAATIDSRVQGSGFGTSHRRSTQIPNPEP